MINDTADNASLLENYRAHMVPNYAPMPMVLDHGSGARIWDVEGTEYIDFAGGIAVSALGHAHPEVVAVISEQAQKLWHTCNIFVNQPQVELAELLCNKTFAEKVFFANSGTEANEAAIKLARRYCLVRNPNKHEIISLFDSFHGRSMMMITVGGQKKYRENFGPIPAGVHYAQQNIISSVEELISEKTAAVIVEPVMGEGGVMPATAEFLQGLRELCDQHQALLIFDEVQCGVGRTGALYAYQHYGITPDILTTAKALGGGIPISALLTTAQIAAVFTPGTHGSTYGGNPFACKVATTVLKLIDTPAVLDSVKRKSKMITTTITQMPQADKVFGEPRGLGLLLGLPLQLIYSDKAALFNQITAQHGLLTLSAGGNVVRLAPPLLISDQEIEAGLTRFAAALEQFAAQA